MKADWKPPTETKNMTDTMKTMLITTLVLLAATFAARAEVITKGGATALTRTPIVASANAHAAMNCPMCKSEFISVATTTHKGTAPVVTTVERHACAGCVTRIVTSGHGKAKAEVAVHACLGCATK
jgi:hypothetical protein